MLATETKKPAASGFGGVKRSKTNGTLQNSGHKGNAFINPASAPEARATNASFDRSPYQKISKSLLQGLPR